MKDPDDNRAILSLARNRVTVQWMWIKRMSIVCFKIRTLLATHILLLHLAHIMNRQTANSYFFKISYWFFNCAFVTLWRLKWKKYIMKAKELSYIWNTTSLGKIAVKFFGSLSLRRISNETLKRDESFIEIIPERREKRELPARLQILRSTKFYSRPRKKRNDSSANARFSSIRSFLELQAWRRNVNI